MSLTRAAIERDRVTLVLLVLVAFAGVQSFLTLPQSEDPGFVVRTAVVQTFFPGGSPQRVEELVTDPLEEAIQEIPELDSVRSTSKAGVSLVFVDIKEEHTDLRPIWDALRRKVERVRPDLPDGVRGPFVDDEFGDVFGIVLTITGDGFSAREVEDVAREVRDELLLLPDVAKVDLFGVQDERIFVEFRDARLAEVGLSPLQLQQMLEARNILISGGSVATPYERIILEPSGNFESVDDLRRTVVQVPSTRELLFLEDLATVRRGTIDPPRALARGVEGPCVALAVSMRDGGNIVTLGTEVEPVLERLQAQYPIGIEFDVVQFAPRTVEALVDGFVVNLYQAIGIVTLVMLVSLGLRTGLVVASLIPMAMLSTLLSMSVFGIGLDQMSIASLIIALGMLVDNAIVMSEAILVRMEDGEEPTEAAVAAANELRIPLLTSSLTTAAAFLPIYLAESAVGEYTAPLFQVVTLTLLGSWVLSLTMIPLLCARALRVEPGDGETSSRLGRSYRRLLRWCLGHRTVFLGGVAVVFALTLVGFGLVPSIFFPPNDRATFTAELELPVGSPIERTTEVVVAVEDQIRSELVTGSWPGATADGAPDGVTNWATFIGNGGPKFTLGYNPGLSAPETAVILANAASRPVIDEIAPRLERWINERFPDVKATVRPLENGPPAWPPVQVRISGRDTEAIFDRVEEVKARLAEVPGTKLIDDDWGPRAKKLRVEIDEPRALRAGVTHQDVAISLQTFLDGIHTTEYREGDRIIPVTLRSVAAERQDLGKIETMSVSSQATGRSVPLKQVADVEIAWEPASIQRRDRLRTVAVECGVEAGTTAADVVAAIAPWLAEQAESWPPGMSYEIGGEVESSGKANASIAAKLPLAGMLIVLLLVGQFNSLRRPAIILITIPLGLIGVVVGLLVADSYFGFMTLLGVISLAGIVINNAIVLLDRIRIEIEDVGRHAYDAILEAARQRLRPILLTTCTTIGGMIPLWLGGGAMWEPMAIAIIFGLAFATALTLGVVPVLYAVFFRVESPERPVGKHI